MNLLAESLQWLTDPSQWSGPAGIPTRVLQHLGVTIIVVALAALVALPVGILVGHTGRGRAAVVAVTGAVRAVPTLGLLTVLGLWLGIGLRAPLLALVVLAIPSILAGTYAGIQALDPVTIDASRAVGMTPVQIVTRVELPLAAPVILGGLRSATLQVVATATLAAYIADVGLGRYVFTGLKSRDYGEMLAGSLIVAVLALALEVGLASLQRRARQLTNPALATAGGKSSPAPTS